MDALPGLRGGEGKSSVRLINVQAERRTWCGSSSSRSLTLTLTLTHLARH